MGNALIFSAPETSYHPLEYEGELLWVERDLNDLSLASGIPCFLLQSPNASRLLIFFHANAEDLGHVYLHLRYLRSLLRVHVLAVEYAGYGICSGIPSEERLMTDADTVFAFVQNKLHVPAHSTMLLGRSLGGCSAIYLASRQKCAGLVTLAAFSSISALAGSLASMVGWITDVFDNGTRIRNVNCRTLIIHGQEDELVGVNQAHALASACGADANERATVSLNIRDGMSHNDFDIKQDVIYPIMEAFPDMYDGPPLPLSMAESLLALQPEQLAREVLSRAPYPPGWVPRRRPYRVIRITGVDGDPI